MSVAEETVPNRFTSFWERWASVIMARPGGGLESALDFCRRAR